MQAAVTDELRLQHLWQTVLTRPANSEELAMLRGLLERQLRRFSANPDAARKLIAVGAPRSEAKLEPKPKELPLESHLQKISLMPMEQSERYHVRRAIQRKANR